MNIEEIIRKEYANLEETDKDNLLFKRTVVVETLSHAFTNWITTIKDTRGEENNSVNTYLVYLLAYDNFLNQSLVYTKEDIASFSIFAPQLKSEKVDKIFETFSTAIGLFFSALINFHYKQTNGLENKKEDTEKLKTQKENAEKNNKKEEKNKDKTQDTKDTKKNKNKDLKDNEPYRLYTEHFLREDVPDYIGFYNETNIIVYGSVGNMTAYCMQKGTLKILGDCETSTAVMMKEGELHIEGNIGECLRRPKEGLDVQIYHKGKLLFQKEEK